MNRRGGLPLRRWLVLVAVATVAAVAAEGCGGGSGGTGSGHQSGGAASPAPSSAPLSAWQKLGAAEVPPDSLRQVSLGSIQVVNEAGGAVSDTQARSWAQAFMREFAYLNWAVSRGQDTFLLQSGLSSTPAMIFQPNLNDIAQARLAGVRVEYLPEKIRRLVVRAVPQGLQGTFQRLQFNWKPYAIFLDAVGPMGSTWVDAQGHRTVKSQTPTGSAAFELVGGELGHDPLMGDVWVVGSDWDCTSTTTRRALAPLCNP